jgi:hypothetical protein
MKEPKDKRTREYKLWKAKHDAKMAGLGDVVDKITTVTGIKKLVKSITDDCGCEERRERWNEKYSFKMKNPLTEDEYNLIKMAIDTNKNKFTPQDQELYKNIFERVFEQKIQCTPCSFKSTVWEKLTKAVNI